MANGNGKDEGTLVAIGEQDGQVMLMFPKPIQWLALDPENARQIAEQIARSAYAAHTGMTPLNQKSYVSENIRVMLNARVTMIIRSLNEQGKSPDWIAREVIDRVLAEVT